MTDRERDKQEPGPEQEGFGWFGVPAGPVVNRKEMEAAMQPSRPRRIWTRWNAACTRTG
ncbi:MAG: hypothetical protein M3N32_00640 [Actinomycetota bacterium]|nr:hypothetical protein [Actinomycetota bacterium]